MTLTCTEIKPYLSRYQDGEANDPLRGRIRRHLEECDHCGQELLLLEQVTGRVGHLPRVETQPNFTAQVMARVLEKERSKTRWFALPSVVYSLVFILVCLLGLLLNPALRTEEPDPAKITDYSTLLVESQRLNLLEVQDKTFDLLYGEERDGNEM